jgi:acetylornithine deacetylase
LWDSYVVRSIASDLDAYVAQRESEWHMLLQSLVQYRSVFEEEHGVIEFVSERLTRLGFEAVRVPHTRARLQTLRSAQLPFSDVPGRCSLVVRIPGRGGGRSLAFNTHLDIVPEGDRSQWTHPPFAGDVEGGVVYGRGAMDDKAGVAIALAVLETMTRMPVPLKGDLVFHFVLEDETTGNGTLLCLDAGHVADAAIIIDGTRTDRAIDAHAGQLAFSIEVTGRPASVSVSHMGINAADVLARLVARLADEVTALNETRLPPWTQFPSPFQLVTMSLSAHGSALTVPDRAAAECYMTFPPPWTLPIARDFLHQTTTAFARERGLAVPPVLRFDRFSAEPVSSSSSSLSECLAAAVAAEGLGPVVVGPSTGTSDLRHFADAGIPCLLYGPGAGFNPHRHDEHYRLEDLGRMVKVFVATAQGVCGSL